MVVHIMHAVLLWYEVPLHCECIPVKLLLLCLLLLLLLSAVAAVVLSTHLWQQQLNCTECAF